MDIASFEHICFSKDVFSILEYLEGDNNWSDDKAFDTALVKKLKSHLHPVTSGPVKIREAFTTDMSLLMPKLFFRIAVTLKNILSLKS